MVSVLVVEDEPALVEVMEASLEVRGYEVMAASGGREAMDVVAATNPDIVLLDLGLPDIDGIEVCRLLRRFFTNPIVVLSGDGAEDRKVAALDAGADDYVTKPFSMPELLARMRVALRHRDAATPIVESTVIVLGDLKLDFGGHIAYVDADELPLTHKEFALLTLLARNGGRVVTHDLLFRHAWDDSTGTAGSLRVHMTHLRKKLGSGPRRPRLETEPGVGYRLSAP